jgi:hypothetical protein
MSEILYNTVSNEVEYYDNAGAKVVVTETGTQTLTNKTIVVASNTITTAASGNLTSTNLNAALAELQTDIDTRETSANVTSGLALKVDKSTLTTKGDLYAASAASTPVRLGVGTDGFILTADSAEVTGIKWAASASAPTAFYELSNLGLECSVAGSALTIALKQSDGSTNPSGGSPVKIGTRSSTITSGAYNQRSSTAATSVVVPSTATLGLNSGSNGYIYVYAIDNSGTIELAVNSIWVTDGIISTTAITTGADTSGFFSTTLRSGVACRMIARLKYNTAPNGTYAATPDEVVLGNATSLRITDEFVTMVSSTKTPGASGRYLNMTGNEVVLQPGLWEINAAAHFGASGTPAYDYISLGLFSSDGLDNATFPNFLLSGTGITVISAGLDTQNGITPFTTATGGAFNNHNINAPTTVIRADRTVTVYPVPFATMTTAGSARVTVSATAKRIS